MKGNFHVQFLGEGVAATSPPYPTPRGAIPWGDTARNYTLQSRDHPGDHRRGGPCPTAHTGVRNPHPYGVPDGGRLNLEMDADQP